MHLIAKTYQHLPHTFCSGEFGIDWACLHRARVTAESTPPLTDTTQALRPGPIVMRYNEVPNILCTRTVRAAQWLTYQNSFSYI